MPNRLLLLCLLTVGFIGAGRASAVTIDWVSIGSPGNAADTEVMTCCQASVGTSGFGAVPYVYRISKYEVTNAQYAEFLNAIASTDTHGLYYINRPEAFLNGIDRSGTPGSYSYSTVAGSENKPVTYVSYWDALRFANWLHNGQPTGNQTDATTEDGAYTITAQGTFDNSVVRNTGAKVFLTSEDEWYKAAYYNTASASYFDYPASTNDRTTCAAPGPTENTANCENVIGILAAVGSYSGAVSPNGTFDQGGNAWELNESVIAGGGGPTVFRGLRGGSLFPNLPDNLRASSRSDHGPTSREVGIGFRVASVSACMELGGDSDLDGVCDDDDNCPLGVNANQADADTDSIGDICDNCPAVTNVDQADADGDAAGDVCDNCLGTLNVSQSDVDGDHVGDACDNCVEVANAPMSAGWLDSNPWAVLTGGQRDDDFDGYGNRCDAKFPGSLGSVVGSGDLTQFRSSNGKSRSGMNCGSSGLLPCAIFDLDESAPVIATPDLVRFRILNGKTVGPKCATCPLSCEAGALRTCEP